MAAALAASMMDAGGGAGGGGDGGGGGGGGVEALVRAAYRRWLRPLGPDIAMVLGLIG